MHAAFINKWFSGMVFDPLGKALFILSHLKALCFITSHFYFYLFPSITNDTHIIHPPSIVSFAYEHFQIKIYAIGLFIQPQKCVAWSPFGLSFYFIKDAMLEDVRHVDLFFKMGVVQVAFKILTHCFMQYPSYILQCTPPSSTFIKSILFYFYYFPPSNVWVPFWDFLIAQKDL